MLTSIVPLPASSQDGGLNGDIGRAEIIFFGKSTPELHAEQRLETLERGIFGKPRNGSLSKRLDRIQKSLGESAKNAATQPETKSETKSQTTTTELAPPAESSSQPKTTQLPPPAESSPEPKAAHLPPRAESSPEPKTTQLPASSEPPLAPRAVKTSKELLQAGAQHYRQGNLLQADAVFRQVLVSDPKNVDALFNLGALAEGRGDYASALDLYRSASVLKPGDHELSEAAESMRSHVSQQHLSVGRPLFGSADFSQATGSSQFAINGPGFSGQQPIFGVSQPNAPSVMVGNVYSNNALLHTPQYSDPPMLQVNQPPSSQIGVAPPRRNASTRRAIVNGIHTGLMFAPIPGPFGALKCPLCSILNRW